MANTQIGFSINCCGFGHDGGKNELKLSFNKIAVKSAYVKHLKINQTQALREKACVDNLRQF